MVGIYPFVLIQIYMKMGSHYAMVFILITTLTMTTTEFAIGLNEQLIATQYAQSSARL